MAIAKFEKVSIETWIKCFQDANPDAKMTEEDKTNLTTFWENIRLPVRATVGSAGYDFFSPLPIMVGPMESQAIPTGIKCKMDPGWVLVTAPKSRYSRFRLGLDHTIGIIDSDYYNNADNEGQIWICIHNGLLPTPPHINKITQKIEPSQQEYFHAKPGTPIIQGIFLPFGLAEEETPTTERTGGFGSTGDLNNSKSPSGIIL